MAMTPLLAFFFVVVLNVISIEKSIAEATHIRPIQRVKLRNTQTINYLQWYLLKLEVSVFMIISIASNREFFITIFACIRLCPCVDSHMSEQRRFLKRFKWTQRTDVFKSDFKVVDFNMHLNSLFATVALGAVRISATESLKFVWAFW